MYSTLTEKGEILYVKLMIYSAQTAVWCVDKMYAL
jgi:hypothetical protein